MYRWGLWLLDEVMILHNPISSLNFIHLNILIFLFRKFFNLNPKFLFANYFLWLFSIKHRKIMLFQFKGFFSFLQIWIFHGIKLYIHKSNLLINLFLKVVIEPFGKFELLQCINLLFFLFLFILLKSLCLLLTFNLFFNETLFWVKYNWGQDVFEFVVLRSLVDWDQSSENVRFSRDFLIVFVIWVHVGGYALALNQACFFDSLLI